MQAVKFPGLHQVGYSTNKTIFPGSDRNTLGLQLLQDNYHSGAKGSQFKVATKSSAREKKIGSLHLNTEKTAGKCFSNHQTQGNWLGRGWLLEAGTVQSGNWCLWVEKAAAITEGSNQICQCWAKAREGFKHSHGEELAVQNKSSICARKWKVRMSAQMRKETRHGWKIECCKLPWNTSSCKSPIESFAINNESVSYSLWKWRIFRDPAYKGCQPQSYR